MSNTSTNEGCLRLLVIPLLGATFVAIIWFAIQIVDTSKRPILVVPGVESSTLYALDLSLDKDNATVVAYNLSAVLSFRNPYIYGIHITWLVAAPSYGGQTLGPDAGLPSFKIGRKKTRTVPLDVQGRQVIGGADLAAVVGRTYAEDAGRGYYAIEAKLQLTGQLSRCRSSCTLYFPAPAAPASRGVMNLFDGEECTTKCKG